MKFKKTILIILLIVGLIVFLGFSHDYKINFEASSSDVIGKWVQVSAPKVVEDRYQNVTASSTLEFQTNGKVIYSIPINSNHGSPSSPSDWYFSSGEGTWNFADWGHKGWHIWRIDLDAEKIGIQLSLKRELSGKKILEYQPDPDLDESVIYSRK